jgi:hypothetical protein
MYAAIPPLCHYVFVAYIETAVPLLLFADDPSKENITMARLLQYV